LSKRKQEYVKDLTDVINCVLERTGLAKEVAPSSKESNDIAVKKHKQSLMDIALAQATSIQNFLDKCDLNHIGRAMPEETQRDTGVLPQDENIDKGEDIERRRFNAASRKRQRQEYKAQMQLAITSARFLLPADVADEWDRSEHGDSL
jgi:hypothetical protein